MCLVHYTMEIIYYTYICLSKYIHSYIYIYMPHIITPSKDFLDPPLIQRSEQLTAKFITLQNESMYVCICAYVVRA